MQVPSYARCSSKPSIVPIILDSTCIACQSLFTSYPLYSLCSLIVLLPSGSPIQELLHRLYHFNLFRCSSLLYHSEMNDIRLLNWSHAARSRRRYLNLLLSLASIPASFHRLYRGCHLSIWEDCIQVGQIIWNDIPFYGGERVYYRIEYFIAFSVTNSWVVGKKWGLSCAKVSWPCFSINIFDLLPEYIGYTKLRDSHENVAVDH